MLRKRFCLLCGMRIQRFFRLGRGVVMHRAYYAASRIFVVKHDDGHTGIYLSELLGNMGVTAIGAILLHQQPECSGEPGAVWYGVGERHDLQLVDGVLAGYSSEVAGFA